MQFLKRWFVDLEEGGGLKACHFVNDFSVWVTGFYYNSVVGGFSTLSTGRPQSGNNGGKQNNSKGNNDDFLMTALLEKTIINVQCIINSQ